MTLVIPLWDLKMISLRQSSAMDLHKQYTPSKIYFPCKIYLDPLETPFKYSIYSLERCVPVLILAHLLSLLLQR